MALAKTTLSADADAQTLRFNVTSATGATEDGYMRVDGEFMKIVKITGTAIDVRSRGDRGGVAVSHDILAPVTFGLDSDMVALPPREVIPIPVKDFDIKSIGENIAALPCPTRDTFFFINKASALATTTLGNPGYDQNGLRVMFINTTDYAAVVTVAGLYDGTTGAHTTLTSPAYTGGGLTIIAWQGLWWVVSNNQWVIS